jgi:dTDP-4-amino-4,6-dideoxygalactose transaminase
LIQTGLHRYGENVNKFEEELSNYVGIKKAAALSAGTAAIQM